jgi:hypothetical protein
MPENIVVTLKTEQSGGVWPFVRGSFAWIGFGLVVGVGVSICRRSRLWIAAGSW